MTLSVYLVLAFAFVGVTLAFSGQFIPKSFYVIDPEGHKSDVVSLRSRREILKPLLRLRRGGGGGGGGKNSASSRAGADSGSSGEGARRNYPNYGGYDPGLVFSDFANFMNNFPVAFGGGESGSGEAGAQSFASSSSSSSSGTGYGGGNENQGHAGGPGAGHNVGSTRPVLFSRFGEGKGESVNVNGAAQGPHGAFSSSSSSIDSEGNIKYSIQSGKN